MLLLDNAAPRHRQRGFSLLPQAVGILLTGILMTVGLLELLPLRGAAERAHVQTVTGGLQSALGLETVRQILDGHNLASLQKVEGSNPVLLLEEQPLNYRGELATRPDFETMRGHWYFDITAAELIYTPKYPQYLCEASKKFTTLRWRVVVLRHSDGQPRSVNLQLLNRHQAWDCGK